MATANGVLYIKVGLGCLKEGGTDDGSLYREEERILSDRHILTLRINLIYLKEATK